jgi:site-specific DNA recombinase
LDFQMGAQPGYALNRFARDRFHHHALRKILAALGTTLRSVSEPIDDTSSGRLMEGVIAAMAQFDNDVRSERTIAGMRARLDRGGWTFPPPLGYLKAVGANGEKTIIADPKRSHLIAQAF